MGILDAAGLSYPDTLAALGRFAAKKGLTDVCLMEFENGFLILGSVLYETGESYNRRTETHVLSIEDLNQLVREGRHESPVAR